MASDHTDAREAEREPDAYMVERQKDGEWRRVVVTNYEEEAQHYARDERRAGCPARVIPLYRDPSAPEPAGDSELIAVRELRERMDWWPPLRSVKDQTRDDVILSRMDFMRLMRDRHKAAAALERLEELRDAADDLVAALDTVPADLAYGPRERQVRRYNERLRAENERMARALWRIIQETPGGPAFHAALDADPPVYPERRVATVAPAAAKEGAE